VTELLEIAFAKGTCHAPMRVKLLDAALLSPATESKHSRTRCAIEPRIRSFMDFVIRAVNRRLEAGRVNR
jgi:hypothetical protein